jgi:hypothetical protein
MEEEFMELAARLTSSFNQVPAKNRYELQAKQELENHLKASED